MQVNLLRLSGQAVTGSYLIGAIWETFVFGELRKYLSLAAPQTLRVHELLRHRARWSVMVICRTLQMFPASGKLIVVTAFRIREHLA